MKYRIKRLAAGGLALLCTCTMHLYAAPEAGSHAETNRKTDWTFTPDAALPNVLILGDSISIGYTRQVRELLKGKANVYRPVNADGTRPKNCNGTVVGLKVAEPMLKAHEWSVIHFNWGLHDLKHVKKPYTNIKSNDPNDPQQSTPQEYEANLREIVQALRKTDARLVFATTTPVVPGTLNPLRTPEAPVEYNAIAVKIMEENQIRMNDLHAYCLPNLAEWQQPKNVHFTPMGQQALAERVAAVISEELAEEKKASEPAIEDSIAGDQPIIRLWPIEQVGGEANRLRYDVTNRGKIRYENVSDPHLVVFPAQAEGPRPAVLYCPGGGYKHLTPKSEVIDWLNECGITVFMLRYTVPFDREAAFRDVQRAMRVVRHRSKDWNIDPDHVGVMGTSAGGHLVLRLSQNYNEPAYKTIDEADQLSCEPAFVITGSAAYLCKSKSDFSLAEEFLMNAKVAPTFMVCAEDDKTHFTGSVVYEKVLRAAGGSTRMVISETGGHGLKGVNWYPECRDWLKELGVGLDESGALASAPPSPNILIIMVDDMGYSDIGCYGGEIKTPNLDSLAANGVRFRRFFNNAKCGASRVSLLMGRSNYAASQGTYNNPTLGHVLKSAGYHTYCSGKNHSTVNLYERGFDHYYGLRDGMCNHWNPGLQREGEPIPGSKKGRTRYWCDDELTFDTRDPDYQHYFPKDFYTTDAFTGKALEYLSEWEKEKTGRPFFLYLAYTAPHDPLHAWPEDLAKYKGRYDEGYEAIRQARYKKQQEIGLVDPKTSPLSPATHKDWSELSEKQQAGQARIMETHAAMIDCIDQRIGEVIQRLKKLGVYENTLILFCSDNGAEKIGSNAVPETIGTLDTFSAIGKDWSNVANTPHRMHKLSAYNGGSRTPMIVHWPKAIKNPGRFTDKFAHLSNVMPTLLEVSGAEYPEEFNGVSGRKLLGESFVDVIFDQPVKQDTVYMNRGGQSFIIDDGWKLVTEDGKNWSLYNLNKEETEITDLSNKEPERFNTLLAKYNAWRDSIKLR
ncbi:sulfatase-like hydrolase/transferase [Pontiellaceae bacterium B12227]|nr:sulfatase-like hydrolase/transferase [Pontiellaceae bacterium B12227]